MPPSALSIRPDWRSILPGGATKGFCEHRALFSQPSGENVSMPTLDQQEVARNGQGPPSPIQPQGDIRSFRRRQANVDRRGKTPDGCKAQIATRYASGAKTCPEGPRFAGAGAFSTRGGKEKEITAPPLLGAGSPIRARRASQPSSAGGPVRPICARRSGTDDQRGG